MEFKDVAKAARNGQALEQKPRALSKLSVSIPEVKNQEERPEVVEQTTIPQPRGKNLESLNRVISAVNSVEEATGTLSKLVGSISGIVQQVEGGGLPKSRISKLEEEANDLVDAITEVVVKPRQEIGSLPVNEKVKDEIEVLDKALQTIFPESSGSLGLGSIKFEPKEQILRVREAVLSAREQIETLRKSVEEAQGQLRGAVNTADVAAQNTEAAAASIRDLEGALRMAGSARERIISNPGDALSSSALTQKSVELLRR